MPLFLDTGVLGLLTHPTGMRGCKSVHTLGSGLHLRRRPNYLRRTKSPYPSNYFSPSAAAYHASVKLARASADDVM